MGCLCFILKSHQLIIKDIYIEADSHGMAPELMMWLTFPGTLQRELREALPNGPPGTALQILARKVQWGRAALFCRKNDGFVGRAERSTVRRGPIGKAPGRVALSKEPTSIPTRRLVKRFLPSLPLSGFLGTSHLRIPESYSQ